MPAHQRASISHTVPFKINPVSIQTDAINENRLISVTEEEMRKKVGVIIIMLTLAVWFLFPSWRSSYGVMSLALGSGVGVYRTGHQSL